MSALHIIISWKEMLMLLKILLMHLFEAELKSLFDAPLDSSNAPV